MSITLNTTPKIKELVKILICAPYEAIRKVTVRSSGRISALQSLWNHKPKTFLYKGHELIESMTFSFYNLKDGEAIIAISKTGLNVDRDKWISMSANQFELNDIILLMMNFEMPREIARLKDLAWNRIYKKRNSFCKLKKAIEDENFQIYNIKTDVKTDQDKNNHLVLEPNLFAPSEEALPILW